MMIYVVLILYIASFFMVPVISGDATGNLNMNAICPNNCVCHDELLTVICKEIGLQEAPITLNPSVERLILKHNKIKTVDVAAFQFYKALKFVDFSDNHLNRIPQNAFLTQSKVLELHLNHNRLSTITDKTFAGLKSLTVLNLRNNFFEILPDKAFNQLANLEELDVGQNRIETINRDAFIGLNRLKVLHLDDNMLLTIPTACFQHLSGLAELRFSLNNITYLPKDAFAGLEHLKLLDVSKIPFKVINDDGFKGLNALRTLILSDNALTEIPRLALAKLPRLEDLIIGQNDIPVIEANSFKGLNYLKKLEISGDGSLTKIENGAFSENLNLEILIFKDNAKLSEIENGALNGLPNLKQLVLRGNGFKTFSEHLAAWPELRKIDIADNKLECNCNLLWLRDFVFQRNISAVYCSTPEYLNNRPMKSLSDDDMGCETYPSRKQTIVGAICGVGLAAIAVLIFVLCKHRHRICDKMKDFRKNNKKQSKVVGSGCHKQSDYQKTYNHDDDFIFGNPILKKEPTTEL